MTIQKIMSLIDDKKIEELGKLYKVDNVNTKITGMFVLKILVNSALKKIPISLRSLEAFTNNNKEASSYLKSKDESKKIIDHSSFGKRLGKMNPSFFKDIYENLAEKCNQEVGEQKGVHIFDSTIITISSKLMRNGLKCGGGKNDTHIKMSVSSRSCLPNSIRFCKNQSESSEDIALVAAINEAKVSSKDVLLFDRGISKSETFKEFTEDEKLFVTRIKSNRKYVSIKNKEIEPYNDNNIKILSDEVVNLYNGKGALVKCDLRLVKASKPNGVELCFLTNIHDISAYEVALTYKKRWYIEVLFKFLKQNLQFKNFISHDSDTMQIYLYCMLIAATLFIMYKKCLNLSGYKIPMLQFSLDLYRSIVKDIVLFCGGDPNLVDRRL